MSAKTQKTIDLLVHGASGRMGQKVLERAKIMGAFKTITPISRFGTEKILGSVIVDFSLPQGFDGVLAYCLRHQIPLVSGTTGLSEEQKQRMDEATRHVPILWSANMSFGVHLFLKMIKEFRFVKDWDFQISETHHVHKKDSPSGTALWLQQELEAVLNKALPEPQGLRRGEVIGDHTVVGKSPLEEVELTHRALDRQVFADGALKAALWLVAQTPGRYSLGDLLKENPSSI